MLSLRRGRYIARIADTPEDVRAAQRLRWLAFVARNSGPDPDALDADDLDALYQHMLIEDARSGQLVCCFRFLTLDSGAQIERSYSARYYDLAALRDFQGPMLEMGRFCIHPEQRDPDILRVAWGAMSRHVEDEGVQLLFGCSSFSGTSPEAYTDAFAMLKDRHLAPRKWLPRVKAPRVFRFARALRLRKPDPKKAMAGMPPLLRSYLLMGGWVSDHAVVDAQLDTLHVFTGLEIAAIPPKRKRLMQAAG